MENNNTRFEEYISKQIDDGYIYPNGAPKKCLNCECEKLIGVNYDYLDCYGQILEYDMKCEDCDTIVGSWAYGNWQI